MASSDSTDRDLPPLPPQDNQADTRPYSYSSDSSRSRRHSSARTGSSLRSFHSELEVGFQRLHERLQSETRRADIAERRAEEAERNVAELTAHLKAINDARVAALREASRANEELKLYRIQLETAQREIYRAQDIVSIVDRQRHKAEKDAAQNRDKVRELNEQVLMQRAREEAYRAGLDEGLRKGRDIAIANVPTTIVYEDDDEDAYSYDSSSRSVSPRHGEQSKPRSIAPSERSRAPTQANLSPLPMPTPLPTKPPSPPPSMHPAQDIKPMSIRSGHSRAPSRVPSRAPSVAGAPSIHPSENALPMSMRNTPRMAPTEPRSRAPSINGAPSVHPSENYGPPSVIPTPYVGPGPPNAIPMPYVGPEPGSRAPSIMGGTPSIHPSENIRPVSVRNIAQTPRRSHSPIPPDNLIPSLDADNRIRIPPPYEFARTPERPISPQLPSAVSDSSQDALPIPSRSNNSQRQRGHTRNSSSGSNSSTLSQLDIINQPFSVGLRTPMSAIPEVSSQYSGSPLPHSDTQGNRQSFAASQRAPSERSYRPPENQMPDRPRSRSSYAGSWVEQQPQNNNRHSRISNTSSAPNINVQPPSQSSLKTDSLWGADSHPGGASPSSSYRPPLPTVEESHDAPTIPGGLPGVYDYTLPTPGPSEGPGLSWNANWTHDGQANDDDAVSSAISGDTLTTPPGQYRSMEPEWAGPGSSNTAMWTVPPPGTAGSVASGKAKRRNSKSTLG